MVCPPPRLHAKDAACSCIVHFCVRGTLTFPALFALRQSTFIIFCSTEHVHAHNTTPARPLQFFVHRPPVKVTGQSANFAERAQSWQTCLPFPCRYRHHGQSYSLFLIAATCGVSPDSPSPTSVVFATPYFENQCSLCLHDPSAPPTIVSLAGLGSYRNSSQLRRTPGIQTQAVPSRSEKPSPKPCE